MIPTLSQQSFITVSVGSEIRMQDGQKPRSGNLYHTAGMKISDSTAASIEEKKESVPYNTEHLPTKVARLQKVLRQVEPRIELSLEKDINRVIFRVVDKETGDLIRQIPPEKVVELDRFLSGQSGLLVEEDI